MPASAGLCAGKKTILFLPHVHIIAEKNANMLTAKIKIANLKTNFAWFVMTKKRIVKLRHANAVRFFKELK